MMINSYISKLMIVSFSCLAFQSVAIADKPSDKSAKNQCDVVSISGTGSLQADGSIIGNETLTVIATGKTTELSFNAITLAAIKMDPANASVTLAASHDFSSAKSGKINFTTFDEITIVPLGGSDTNCIQNVCGLIFKLKLKKGDGRYNCGEIVSGFNPDPAALVPFTSYINPFNPAANGDTVKLGSLGKLCQCSGDD